MNTDWSFNHYQRRRWKAAVFAGVLILGGIAWRTLPLGLPRVAYKYGGSFLWGAMVYWVVAAVWPRMRPRYVLLVAAVAAAGTEASRLYHTPSLDAFRATLAGRLLLGQYFALRNLVVYWAGMGLAVLVDRVQVWPEMLEGANDQSGPALPMKPS